MWTRSPFNAYNSEWVWAICNPDQTRKEDNQKLQGSLTSNITSNLILIIQRIWKFLSLRLYYVASFCIKSHGLHKQDSSLQWTAYCMFYPNLFAGSFLHYTCLFHLIYVFSFFVSVLASVHNTHAQTYTHAIVHHSNRWTNKILSFLIGIINFLLIA